MILHYIKPLNSFLGILIYTILFVPALYFLFTKYLNIPLNDGIFWSAALGISGFVQIKFIETRARRYNILCHLQVELNQAMDALSNIILTLQFMISHSIPIILPHDMPCLTMDYIKEVGRLDVKNNLASLLCDFRRINQDWNNLVTYGKDQTAIIDDPQHPLHQQVRVEGTKLFNFILKRAQDSLEFIETTLVLVRIYCRSDKPFLRFEPPFIWPSKQLNDVQKEKNKLIAEKMSHNPQQEA